MVSTTLKPALPVSSCGSHSVHGPLSATGIRNETVSIWSLHWTMAERVTDGSLQDGPASFCTIHVSLHCCYPGSPSLTVLHVTTRHFTSLMLLIFSSTSSFFTSGWKYCSCSSASACGGTQKGLWGDKDGRSHSINGRRQITTRPAWK